MVESVEIAKEVLDEKEIRYKIITYIIVLGLES